MWHGFTWAQRQGLALLHIVGMNKASACDYSSWYCPETMCSSFEEFSGYADVPALVVKEDWAATRDIVYFLNFTFQSKISTANQMFFSLTFKCKMCRSASINKQYTLCLKWLIWGKYLCDLFWKKLLYELAFYKYYYAVLNYIELDYNLIELVWIGLSWTVFDWN